MRSEYIPIYKPEITSTEKEYVLDCLETTWISSKGKYVNQFESAISSLVQVPHAIAVSNGTVALHLAMLGLQIGPGDEVIVPDFSYIASGNAIHYVGATPVFVDVSSDDWNITLQEIKAHTTDRTKAIIVVDIYGLIPSEIIAIKKFAQENGIWLIEDAAESIGASVHDRPAGSFGDISTFSFFGNKTITTGEGGMVVTRDHHTAELIRQLKNQGNAKNRRYFHDIIGYNYRMTNIQAAIGCAQIERIDEILARKQEIYLIYRNELMDHVEFQEIKESFISSHWLTGFICSSRSEKEKIALNLEASGIETRPFFPPMSQMPFNSPVQNKNSQKLHETGILLPSFHSISNTQLEYIIGKVKSCFE